MEEVKSKSYTLSNEDGWLGQVVLTSDGMFSAVTEFGNVSYAWRYFKGDFRKFLIGLNVDYFATKIYQGIAYMSYGKKYEKACKRFAEVILPVLQEVLKEELQSEQKDGLVSVNPEVL